MLTVQDIAQRLNVSQACVYRIVQSGKLACHRIGNGRGTVRISEEDFDEYVRGCRGWHDGGTESSYEVVKETQAG